MSDISTYTMVLGTELAAHLLRRTTFGPTRAMIDNYAKLTPTQAVAQILNTTAVTNLPIEPAQGNATWVTPAAVPASLLTYKVNGAFFYKPQTEDVFRVYIIAWFLENARTDYTIKSKLMLFYHQNFIVDDKSRHTFELYDYLKLLEYYSTGATWSYRNLAEKMTLDNRMLDFLSGNLNKLDPATGAASNENYGREFLELFTIGKGPEVTNGDYTNYNEADVKAGARVLSGWVNDSLGVTKDSTTGIRCGKPNVSQHVTGNKQFSADLGNTVINGGATATIAGMRQEISNYTSMVFAQKATAVNIATKMYRFFVKKGDAITATLSSDIQTNIIIPLANTLFNNGYDMKLALTQLLTSKHFYGADTTSNVILGGMEKSPLDLLFNSLRFFNIDPTAGGQASTINVYNTFYKTAILTNYLNNSEFPIFKPTTVAGYPGLYLSPKFDRNWFDTSSLPQRFYLPQCLLTNKTQPYHPGNTFGLPNIGKNAPSAQIPTKIVGFDIVAWVNNNANISDPTNPTTIINEMANYLFPQPLSSSRFNYFLTKFVSTLSPGQTTAQMEWAYEWSLADKTTPGSISTARTLLENLFQALIASQEFQLQ